MTTRKTHWQEHAETYVNGALEAYKTEQSPSAGMDIISYAEKNVLQVKEQFVEIANQMFSEWQQNDKFVYLRLAKIGALEWNGQ